MRSSRRSTMAAVSRRPHPLHNFSLPSLRWGNRRNLRCLKPKPSDENRSPRFRSSPSSSESNDCVDLTSPDRPETIQRSLASSVVVKQGSPGEACSGTKKIRQKLLVHLQPRVIHEKESKSLAGEGGKIESLEMKPRNAKKRRALAACNAPIDDGQGASGAEAGIGISNPTLPSQSRPKSFRLRGLAPPELEEAKKMEIPKLSISLSREEIEESFLAMTGSKPPRRPKKRARVIQKKLDELFPGLWLSDITLDSYKIPDHPGQ